MSSESIRVLLWEDSIAIPEADIEVLKAWSKRIGQQLKIELSKDGGQIEQGSERPVVVPDPSVLVGASPRGMLSVTEAVKAAFLPLAPLMAKELDKFWDGDPSAIMSADAIGVIDPERRWPGYESYTSISQEELLAKMREAAKTFVMTPLAEDDPKPIIVSREPC